MSKKFKAVVILTIILCVIVGSFLFVVLKPSRWSVEFITYLNDNILRDNGWTISVESMDGRFTSDIIFRNLYLKNDDSSVSIFSERSRVNLDFSKILTGKWAVSDLECENALVTLKMGGGESRQRELTFVKDLAHKGFSIRNLSVKETSLIVQDSLGESLYAFDLEGQIHSQDDFLRIRPRNFHVTDLKTRRHLILTGGEIDLGPRHVAAEAIEGSAGNFPFSITGIMTFSPKTELSVQLTLQGIDPKKYLTESYSQFLPAEEVDLELKLNTDLLTAHIDAMVYSSGRLKILSEGSLDLEKSGNDLTFRNGTLRIGSLRMSGDGSFLRGENLNLNLQVDSLNLKEFRVTANPTDITGSIRLSSTFGSGGIDDFTSIVALQNEEEGSQRFVMAAGRIDYKEDVIEFPDSLILDFGYGEVVVNGKFDLSKERVNVSLTADRVDLYPLGYVLGLESLRGDVQGTLNIVGYLRDPTVDGLLTVREGGYEKVAVSSASVSFLVHSIVSNRNGSMKAVASEGTLFDRPFDRGEFDVYFRGDTIRIANARIEGQNDYLTLSGKIVEYQSLLVDQMQLALKDKYFTNIGPIALHRLPDGLVFDPATFRMDEGEANVSFAYRGGQLKDGLVRVINLDLKDLWSVVGRDIPFVGAAFAEIEAKTVNGQLQMTGTVEVKDGVWNDIKFSNFLLTGSLGKNVLFIKEVRLTGPGNVSMTLSGFCGIKRSTPTGALEVDRESEVEFSSELRNFELALVADYIFEGWQLGGTTTGSFAMSGTASSPEIVFQFTIDNPRLDKIHGKTISGSGRYTDQRLYFEDLVGYTTSGHYVGEGYLPVDLALLPREKDRFLELDPISMKFRASTSRLDFLTPYFADIDSISGDIAIELSIEGTPSRPVRNGSIEVTDGRIYALMLDSPIKRVNGSATLKDNKFIIDKLTAASHAPPDVGWAKMLKSNLSQASGGKLFGKTKTPPEANIRITGSMDMTEFFRPSLAFLVSGKKVYIRTLLGEIEGIASLNLSVTGKDTVSIEGDIVPRESVLRMEFAGGESYDDVTYAEGTVTRYKLHFPIAGNLFIRNSQIDAELEGDMSIFKLGAGPYRYSGELNMLGGKFYYYSDVFNIISGHLMFDPTEFNPRMDIRATTAISGIDIEVTLSGDFEEPVVTIEDSRGFYSQGDLLQLLTMQKRFDQQGPSGGDLRAQPVYLLTKYLESELERSLARATPFIDDFDIEGSSSLLDNREDSDRAVKVGTRFSPNLYLSYKQSFSLTKPQVGAEYRLNRNVSLVVTYDENTGEMELKYRRKYKF